MYHSAPPGRRRSHFLEDCPGVWRYVPFLLSVSPGICPCPQSSILVPIFGVVSRDLYDCPQAFSHVPGEPPRGGGEPFQPAGIVQRSPTAIVRTLSRSAPVRSRISARILGGRSTGSSVRSKHPQCMGIIVRAPRSRKAR